MREVKRSDAHLLGLSFLSHAQLGLPELLLKGPVGCLCLSELLSELLELLLHCWRHCEGALWILKNSLIRQSLQCQRGENLKWIRPITCGYVNGTVKWMCNNNSDIGIHFIPNMWIFIPDCYSTLLVLSAERSVCSAQSSLLWPAVWAL